jgi:SAM-dependent methyltransferase
MKDFKHYTYDHLPRFVSYWHQLSEVLKRTDLSTKMLEVGIGNGFTSNYLKSRGYDIQTFDNDPNNKPDYLGDLLNTGFRDGQFDVVLCFQVLEHLPYENFKSALNEMSRVTSKYVVISVPDARRYIEISFKFLFQRLSVNLLQSVPTFFLRNPTKVKENGHYWEIGWRGYALSSILRNIPFSLKLEKNYRVPGNAYHHIFVFKKVNI